MVRHQHVAKQSHGNGALRIGKHALEGRKVSVHRKDRLSPYRAVQHVEDKSAGCKAISTWHVAIINVAMAKV